MVQTTLHFMFLDLQKTYGTVNRERLLEILEITILIALAPRSYKLNFIHQSRYSLHKVPYLVEGCRYTATIAANLQRHFFNRH